MKVNMAEGPSTTAIPSNQFIVNAVCMAIMCTSTYGVLVLVSHLRHYARRTTNTTSMPWLYI